MTTDGSNASRACEGGDQGTSALWTALSNLEQKLDACFETVMTSFQRVMAQVGIDDTNLQRDPPPLRRRDEVRTSPPPPRQGFRPRGNLVVSVGPIDLYALEGHLDAREPLALLDSDEEDEA